MVRDPSRGHAALRRGRFSQPGATYFLTLCTNDRRSGLTLPSPSSRVAAEREAMQQDATWHVRCATIMPDHVHSLIVLGERLSLERSVGRLKGKTSAVLREFGLAWERGCFDHKLRTDEALLPIFLYIYLNPYRAGSLPPGKTWPYFFCAPDDWLWFRDHLQDDLPLPEWLSPR